MQHLPCDTNQKKLRQRVGAFQFHKNSLVAERLLQVVVFFLHAVVYFVFHDLLVLDLVGDISAHAVQGVIDRGNRSRLQGALFDIVSRIFPGDHDYDDHEHDDNKFFHIIAVRLNYYVFIIAQQQNEKSRTKKSGVFIIWSG